MKEMLNNCIFSKKPCQVKSLKNCNYFSNVHSKKLLTDSGELLRFVKNRRLPGDIEKIPPTHNNFGEYIIKKGVLKRKISGGSMSEEGVRAYAVLQSIAQTCHLRKLSFLGFLNTSLVHYIQTGKPLLLNQYESQLHNDTNKEAA